MLEAKWTWAVDTAMHLGSGLSRAGFADRLIQRDAQGNPRLPNDAVKGALRMSAERVAAWLGASQEAFYHENEPYAPATRPMQLLFGETSGYSAGRLTDRTRTRSRVVSSTAIDAESGTARHDTLRNIEFLNSADLAFECAAQFELIPAAESSEFVETLLAATLAATDNVGAKAGNNSPWGDRWT